MSVPTTDLMSFSTLFPETQELQELFNSLSPKSRGEAFEDLEDDEIDLDQELFAKFESDAYIDLDDQLEIDRQCINDILDLDSDLITLPRKATIQGDEALKSTALVEISRLTLEDQLTANTDLLSWDRFIKLVFQILTPENDANTIWVRTTLSAMYRILGKLIIRETATKRNEERIAQATDPVTGFLAVNSESINQAQMRFFQTVPVPNRAELQYMREFDTENFPKLFERYKSQNDQASEFLFDKGT